MNIHHHGGRQSCIAAVPDPIMD